jgi:hypothetical protein
MEANDASLGPGDATTRAQELRASLGARQDAEALLAEAGRIRQEAAVAADALVEEAQTLSAQLVRESRELADQTAAEARDRADGILARARLEAEELADRAKATADAIRAKAESEVEEHRRRVRAEVTELVTRDLTDKHQREVAAQREQSEALISDLEASVRILGVSLQSALANVSELLGSIEGLRSSNEGGPVPARTAAPDRASVEASVEPVPAVTEAGAGPATDAVPDPATGPDAEPVRRADDGPSYDVGNPAPATTVPSPVSQFRADPDDESAPARPRSATEAFLNSSSLEIEQASRELRDLQNTEETRRRRSEESRRAAQRRELEEGLADDDPDPADPPRPLGWLFRTAQ